MIAAAAMLMSMAACEGTGPEGNGTDNGEGEGGESASYSIALSDPMDAEIILNSDDTETFKIGLKTDLTEDQLSVSETTGADWCSATITDNADSIRIIPGANPSEEDITAEFKVEGVGVEVTPLTFKVTRRGTNTEPVVEISADGITVDEYGGRVYKIPAAQNTLTVTVTTNMARWYLTEMNQVFDENYNPIEWYTVDKTSGRSGETATIVFSENTGTTDRMVNLTFDYEPDSYMGQSIMVTQSAAPATYAKVTLDYGSSYLEETSYEVNFGKDDTGNLYVNVASNMDLSDENVVSLISRCLKSLAKRLAPQVVIKYAQEVATEVGARPSRFVIGSGLRKLGHCTRAREIQLSYNIVFLPSHLARFIILHEITHLTHFNHSPEFHALLNSYCGGNEKALINELKHFPWPVKL